MSWLADTLREPEGKKGAAIGGIVGILIAIISNVDKISDAYDKFLKTSPPAAIDGTWLGVFRELNGGQLVTSAENVEIKKVKDKITGHVSIGTPVSRSHDITGGSSADGFLIVEIRGSDGDRGPGAEVYLLRGSPETGVLRGYWTGWDPEEQKVMTCPYVLARERHFKTVESSNSQWLQRDCYK